ncbi:hypothetical protein MY4038_005656 [Beauveria bassiana]
MTPSDSRARHHILPESSAQPMGTGAANTARHRYKKSTDLVTYAAIFLQAPVMLTRSY